MGDMKRSIEILSEQVEKLERGMFRLHYQLLKAGYDPGDDLYIIAGYDLESLMGILDRARDTVEREVTI